MPSLPRADEAHVVTSGYWKTIADWSGVDLSVAAFVMTQDVARNTDVSSFAVSVAEVETSFGLDFSVELSAEDQSRLEADVDSSWFLK